jgi:FMN phosphatase YigB (HAD superfamily)
MVGDSVSHDVEGALAAGLQAILLHRSEISEEQFERLRRRGVPVIRSLRDLPRLVSAPVK